MNNVLTYQVDSANESAMTSGDAVTDCSSAVKSSKMVNLKAGSKRGNDPREAATSAMNDTLTNQVDSVNESATNFGDAVNDRFPAVNSPKMLSSKAGSAGEHDILANQVNSVNKSAMTSDNAFSGRFSTGVQSPGQRDELVSRRTCGERKGVCSDACDGRVCVCVCCVAATVAESKLAGVRGDQRLAVSELCRYCL